ncbi:MAG: hypothetical protein COU45_01135, partial [Nitrosopumilus sp. CG10_big_fil_rev_8_21_14_0_10_33_7]
MQVGDYIERVAIDSLKSITPIVLLAIILDGQNSRPLKNAIEFYKKPEAFIQAVFKDIKIKKIANDSMSQVLIMKKEILERILTPAFGPVRQFYV